MEEDFNTLCDMLVTARRLNETTYREALVKELEKAIREHNTLVFLRSGRLQVVDIDKLIEL